MKRLIAPLVLGLALAGCVVESVYPWYTVRDVEFDPALVGPWVEAGVTNAAGEGWTFQPSGKDAYLLTTIDDSKTNRYQAHLFRLGAQRFLDACPTNRVDGQVPVHYLLAVSSVQPTLQMATLNYDWLTKLLAKDPGALRHLVVPDERGDAQDGLLVLTADTRELQKFLARQVGNTNAWQSLKPMSRRTK